jgi:hypothetical protein
VLSLFVHHPSMPYSRGSLTRKGLKHRQCADLSGPLCVIQALAGSQHKVLKASMSLVAHYCSDASVEELDHST